MIAQGRRNACVPTPVCPRRADTLRPCDFDFFSIVSRWAAYVSNPPGVKKTGGWRSWKRSWKRFRINHQLRSPIFFRGHLAPLSRRPYQPENRFSSVSRPFLNVSGAASRLRPGTNPELRWRGFTKLRRSARPGFTAGWIMREGVVARGVQEWEVVEYGQDGGERGTGTAKRIGPQMRTDKHR
jgi:hypothetical protein